MYVDFASLNLPPLSMFKSSKYIFYPSDHTDVSEGEMTLYTASNGALCGVFLPADSIMLLDVYSYNGRVQVTNLRYFSSSTCSKGPLFWNSF